MDRNCGGHLVAYAKFACDGKLFVRAASGLRSKDERDVEYVTGRCKNED